MTLTLPRRLGLPVTSPLPFRLLVLGFLVGAGLFALPRTALGQSVSNPRIVEFFPSPDHNRVLTGGQSAVTSYAWEVYPAGGSTPAQTIQMGKPAIGTDGLLRYDFSANTGWAVNGTVYESRIAVAGPQGTARSIISNQFTFGAGGCTYSLSPTSASVAATAGSGSVTVTTGAGCAWTVTSNAGWLVPGVTSGSGGGSVTYTVAANTGAGRSGQLTIAGLTLTVNQAGAATGAPAAPTGLRVIVP
jgi:hypothetical protein